MSPTIYDDAISQLRDHSYPTVQKKWCERKKPEKNIFGVISSAWSITRLYNPTMRVTAEDQGRQPLKHHRRLKEVVVVGLSALRVMQSQGPAGKWSPCRDGYADTTLIASTSGARVRDDVQGQTTKWLTTNSPLHSVLTRSAHR